MKKETESKKSKDQSKPETAAKKTASEQKAPVAEQDFTPIEKIKQSFSDGVSSGRRTFLKKLMQVKGLETGEIQKLYSTGMMEPELLNDLSLTDLVKVSGIKMDFARIIKEVISRKDSDLPFEYERLEIERLNKESNNIQSETESVRKEIEQLNKEYNSLQEELETKLDKGESLRQKQGTLDDVEKKHYYKEKTIQDEVLFVIEEQKAFQQEVDRCSKNFGYSETELNTIKREFSFTKGECSYILEKINYLLNKLDRVLKVKGVSQDRLTTFLSELRRVHDTLIDAYQKTNKKYYENKQ